MKRKQQSVNESRRRLLGGALALGAVGTGLGVLGVNLAPQAAPAISSTGKSESRGYRETEHIRQYYRTTA
jgi:ferric-dicitrate binding protein FerR (iron transport regulator)